MFEVSEREDFPIKKSQNHSSDTANFGNAKMF